MIKMMNNEEDGQTNAFQEIMRVLVGRNSAISQESLMHNSDALFPAAAFSNGVLCYDAFF